MRLSAADLCGQACGAQALRLGGLAFLLAVCKRRRLDRNRTELCRCALWPVRAPNLQRVVMAASMKNDKGYGTIAVRSFAPCTCSFEAFLLDSHDARNRLINVAAFCCVQEVHMQGGYCSVDWDNGTHDRCLFTGQQQVLSFHATRGSESSLFRAIS